VPRDFIIRDIQKADEQKPDYLIGQQPLLLSINGPQTIVGDLYAYECFIDGNASLGALTFNLGSYNYNFSIDYNSFYIGTI
jgi:hypothetical protein